MFNADRHLRSWSAADAIPYFRFHCRTVMKSSAKPSSTYTENPMSLSGPGRSGRTERKEPWMYSGSGNAAWAGPVLKAPPIAGAKCRQALLPRKFSLRSKLSNHSLFAMSRRRNLSSKIRPDLATFARFLRLSYCELSVVIEFCHSLRIYVQPWRNLID